MKQKLMTPTRRAKKHSRTLAPSCCSSRKSMALVEVTRMPAVTGMPKSIFRAKAVPMTSGMSLAMMASSERIQSALLCEGVYSWRHIWLRCLPVATASLTHRI